MITSSGFSSYSVLGIVLNLKRCCEDGWKVSNGFNSCKRLFGSTTKKYERKLNVILIRWIFINFKNQSIFTQWWKVSGISFKNNI